MATKGRMAFKGDYGRPETQIVQMVVSNPIGIPELATLQGSIAALSDAVAASHSLTTVVPSFPASPNASADMDKKLVIQMIDLTTGNPVRVEIPAPKASTYEETTAGDRATSATLTTVGGAYTTATGRAHQATHGWLEDSK